MTVSIFLIGEFNPFIFNLTVLLGLSLLSCYLSSIYIFFFLLRLSIFLIFHFVSSYWLFSSTYFFFSGSSIVIYILTYQYTLNYYFALSFVMKEPYNNIFLYLNSPYFCCHCHTFYFLSRVIALLSSVSTLYILFSFIVIYGRRVSSIPLILSWPELAVTIDVFQSIAACYYF